MKNLSIGQLAAATGVSVEAIRYYERESILPQATRTANGRRIYSEEDVKRLTFIGKCRKLGFSLKEIHNLLDLVGSGRYSCKEINSLTASHISNVQLKIKELQRMERALQDMAAQCSRGMMPDCPIIESLYDSSDNTGKSL